MSDTDSFIEEVSEEVRRDQLWGYVRKFGWIVVLLILLAVGFTAWGEYRKSRAAMAAQELGDRIVAAGASGDAAQRAAALGAVVPEAGKADVVVRMRQAGDLVEAGDEAGALAVYDAIASDGSDPIYADLAALKAIVLRGPALSTESRIAALETLAAPGAPFRTLALEQQAMALVEAGRKDEAIGILSALFEDNDSTDGLRQRVSQLIVALGGELPSSVRLLSGQ